MLLYVVIGFGFICSRYAPARTARPAPCPHPACTPPAPHTSPVWACLCSVRLLREWRAEIAACRAALSRGTARRGRRAAPAPELSAAPPLPGPWQLRGPLPLPSSLAPELSAVATSAPPPPPPPPSDGQAPPAAGTAELEAPPPPGTLRVAWAEEPRRSPRHHSSEAVASMAAPLAVLRRLCGLSPGQPAGLELGAGGGGGEGGGEGSGPAEPPPPPWVPPASWFAPPLNPSQVAVLEALEVRHVAHECACARKRPRRGCGAPSPPPHAPAPTPSLTLALTHSLSPSHSLSLIIRWCGGMVTTTATTVPSTAPSGACDSS